MQLPKGELGTLDGGVSTSAEGGVVEGGGGGGGFKKQNRRKSGKKSRLLQKAKKNAKQGRLGRGFEVDSATYNYFLQVLELWQKNEFENEEERAIFVENSFTQTEGNEVNYSSNQMTSRVIETILPSASEGVLLRFGAAFAPSLRTLCADPFASHVVEKLLEVASSEKWATTKGTKVGEWFRTTANYVLNNLEEFTWDPYANHVMRKVCQCLTGFVQETGQAAIQQQKHSGSVQRPKPSPGGGGAQVFGERPLHPKNTEIFTNFYHRFLAWPQFYDLFGAELTSGLVQTVLKTAARVATVSDSKSKSTSGVNVNLEEGINQVCSALGPELDLSNNVHASLYTRMLEVCLPLSGPSWASIFTRYFSTRLVSFGLHEKGKFSLKKVIETCPDKEQFETIFDEIHPAFGDVYKAEATSLFSSLAEACKRWGSRQTQFIQSLTDLLEVGPGENFISRLAMFGGKLELKEDGQPKYITQFVGTMIIQNLIEFHKPLKVISSMLEMEGSNLTKLAMDPKGSHIFDAFFKSATIGEKNKEKMLSKLKEYLVSLSLNKFGSRVLDTIWGWGSMKQKAIVAAALCDRVAQLNGNPFGKFIAEKMSLHVYKRDPKLWAESLEKDGKRRKEAVDFLEEFLGEDKVEVEDKVDEDDVGKKSKKKRKKDKKVTEAVEEEEEPEIEVKVQLEEPEVEEGAKRKRKKSKKQSVDEVEEQEQEESGKSSKKKKSKRKHQDEEGESQIPDSTTTTNDQEELEQPERKKKKKKDRKNREVDAE